MNAKQRKQTTRTMIRTWLTAMSFVAAALLAGDARAEHRPIDRGTGYARLDDESIKASIFRSLARADVPISRVEVEIAQGNVTLRGTVPRYADKLDAARVVARLPGVVRLWNRIEADPKPVADATLQMQVEEALAAAPQAVEDAVAVRVRGGIVHLAGSVSSTNDARVAEEIVGRVDGVRAIENGLRISPTVRANEPLAMTGCDSRDDELTRAIKRAFFWSPSVNAPQVHVSSCTGVVTLTGEVDSWLEKSKAEQHAMGAGARRVSNRLVVDADTD